MPINFKLPKLQSRSPIVDKEGRPSNYFLRFLNVDYSGAIETQENNQAALIAAIQQVQQDQADQLALIIAAQNRADEAYALASSAQGARYISFSGMYPTVSGVINDQSSQSMLALSGIIEGGTIDADSSWSGQIEFFEQSGGAALSLGVSPLVITSNGLSISPTEWQTNSKDFGFDVTGTLSGSVTYSVTGSYSSGANFVQDPTIYVTLLTTPEAV